jgi:hypothetical protein
MTSGHKKQKKEGLGAMSQGNALDISMVWLLNGHQLPARTSEGGRFPDEIVSVRKHTSPAMAEAVWFDFGSSQCAVPAIFSQFEYPKVGACCA